MRRPSLEDSCRASSGFSLCSVFPGVCSPGLSVTGQHNDGKVPDHVRQALRSAVDGFLREHLGPLTIGKDHALLAPAPQSPKAAAQTAHDDHDIGLLVE